MWRCGIKRYLVKNIRISLRPDRWSSKLWRYSERNGLQNICIHVRHWTTDAQHQVRYIVATPVETKLQKQCRSAIRWVAISGNYTRMARTTEINGDLDLEDKKYTIVKQKRPVITQPPLIQHRRMGWHNVCMALDERWSTSSTLSRHLSKQYT